jgi:hypothetical protein
LCTEDLSDPRNDLFIRQTATSISFDRAEGMDPFSFSFNLDGTERVNEVGVADEIRGSAWWADNRLVIVSVIRGLERGRST